MPAILLQARIVQITGLVQIHLHAVNDGLQVFAVQSVSLQMRLQSLSHRMGWIARQHGRDFFAPPHQFGARHAFVGAVVDCIVDLAAESIQRRDGASPLCRQEQEAVIKTGSALSGLLLAVIVWGHGYGERLKNYLPEVYVRTRNVC